MDYLGNLKGRGRVVVGDANLGSVSYDIQVYRSVIRAPVIKNAPGPGDRLPGLKEARGRIEAEFTVMKQIMDARMAVLELDGGGTVDFFITIWNPPSRHADITITGPIPGF